MTAATTTYWVPQAWLPLTQSPSQSPVGSRRELSHVVRGVRISLDGNLFGAIVSGVRPQPDDTILDGMMVPGAANCHSHAFHRALRGLGNEGDTFWQWRTTMYRIANRLTPELYYEFAKAIYVEMLLSGYTTVSEFHYVHHQPDGTAYADPNAMGKALISAARDAGIRMTLLDVCYLHANTNGASVSQEQRRFSDGSARAWCERVQRLADEVEGLPGVRIGAAVHSVRACTRDEAAVVAAWSQSGHSARPLHVHLSEQEGENADCMVSTGHTPTALLADAGVWGAHSVAVHATHLSDGDMAILADHGASVAMCPTTESDLADGIGPAAALHALGVPICIGSDENVCIDPFEEIRLLDNCQRLVSGQRSVFGRRELMAMMTINGQCASGWPEAGLIAQGYAADFVILDTTSPRTAGASPEGVPMTASGADVTDVFVAGQRVVSHRLHMSGSPARTLSEVTAHVRDLTHADAHKESR